MNRRFLLFCGILASLLYVAINIVTAVMYEGYKAASQTVSELSAIGTPTRPLWVAAMILYSVLIIAFGVGIWQSANGKRSLKLVAAFFITYATVGFFWPPMHQRTVLAAGGGTLSDTFHIVFTFITVPLMALTIGFGAAAFGKAFRLYSIVTLLLLIFFGVLTGMESPKVSLNLYTPFLGIWERMIIAVHLLWVIVLSVLLLIKPPVSRLPVSDLV